MLINKEELLLYDNTHVCRLQHPPIDALCFVSTSGQNLEFVPPFPIFFKSLPLNHLHKIN